MTTNEPKPAESAGETPGETPVEAPVSTPEQDAAEAEDIASAAVASAEVPSAEIPSAELPSIDVSSAAVAEAPAPDAAPTEPPAVDAAPADAAPAEPAAKPKRARKPKAAPAAEAAGISQAEIAELTSPPSTDPELDEVDAADIDAGEEPETPFSKIQAQSKRMSPDKVRTVLESLLFVADKPLSVDQLFEATGIDRARITEGLEKLAGMRRDGISGIVLHEVAGGWQLRTDPGSADYVRRYLKVKPQRLTRAAVETLAIIAYRQPVTRPEVEDIRGVDTGAVIKALLERRMIKILGRKEEIGRPILYGTTPEFLEFFALRDLSSLPTLREFQELSEEHQAIVEKETPVEKPGAAGTVEALADPTFKAKLESESAASEAALAELEAAIDGTDTRSKALEKTLEPPAPPAPPPVDGAPPAGAAPGPGQAPTPA
jgi:segregation and condensation protein B